jgi:hypothetical protein
MEKRIYEPKEVISFRKTTEAFGGLSNMASGFGLFVNDIIIPSSEHLYQAMRFPLFPDIQHEIISQENAMLAKKVSNKSAFLLYNRPIEVVCDSDKFADFEIKEGDYELA